MTTEEEKLKAQEEAQKTDPTGQPTPEQGQEPAPAPTESQDPTQGSEVAPEENPAAPENAPQQPIAKTFTQDEVNSMMGKTRIEAREKAKQECLEEIRSKYGIDDDNQLDALVGNGQRYDVINDQYEAEKGRIGELESENALLRSGIPENRFNDVKAILSFNKQDITPENIASAMATHPEWKSESLTAPAAAPAQPQATQPSGQSQAPSVVAKMGGEPNTQPTASSEDEKKQVMQDMFGR